MWVYAKSRGDLRTFVGTPPVEAFVGPIGAGNCRLVHDEEVMSAEKTAPAQRAQASAPPAARGARRWIARLRDGITRITRWMTLSG
jgi:hypothetical protein